MERGSKEMERGKEIKLKGKAGFLKTRNENTRLVVSVGGLEGGGVGAGPRRVKSSRDSMGGWEEVPSSSSVSENSLIADSFLIQEAG